jgi:hypothetical protein
LKTFVTILSALTIALLITACQNQNEGKKTKLKSAKTAKLETTPAPAESAPPTLSPSPTPGPEGKAKTKWYDFRRADWGMTKAQVKASEPKKPAYETADSVTYDAAVWKMFAYVTYQFKAGKLYRAGFIFAERRDTDQQYVDDYETIKKEISQANGKPSFDSVKQLNPNVDVSAHNTGAAVCRGDLVYGAQWNIPRSVIRLFLQGKDSKCILTAIYTSVEADQPNTDMDGVGNLK